MNYVTSSEDKRSSEEEEEKFTEKNANQERETELVLGRG